MRDSAWALETAHQDSSICLCQWQAGYGSDPAVKEPFHATLANAKRVDPAGIFERTRGFERGCRRRNRLPGRAKTTGFFRTQAVSESNGPYVYTIGTDLVLRKADGSEEVLVAGSRTDRTLKYLAVHDFCVSIDGQSILYSHVFTRTDVLAGYVFADIFRINLADKQITRLTDARNEFSPTTGSHGWRMEPLLPSQDHYTFWDKPYLPTWNTSPCECGDGTIVFTSNRNGVKSPKEGFRAMQLYRMDARGKNVEKIGHLNLAGSSPIDYEIWPRVVVVGRAAGLSRRSWDGLGNLVDQPGWYGVVA